METVRSAAVVVPVSPLVMKRKSLHLMATAHLDSELIIQIDAQRFKEAGKIVEDVGELAEWHCSPSSSKIRIRAKIMAVEDQSSSHAFFLVNENFVLDFRPPRCRQERGTFKI